MPDVLRQFKATVFQALAHPTRIAIVEVLRDGEMPAGAIIEKLGLEQANTSQHLSVLRARNIVVSRKEGNQVFMPCAIHYSSRCWISCANISRCILKIR